MFSGSPLILTGWCAAALCAGLASVLVAPGALGVLGGGLAIVMLAIASIDARHFLIPDKLVFAGLLLGCAAAFVARPESRAVSLALAALRGVLVALLFFAFRVFYRWVRRREGLGLGDVKLAGVAGVWLGWAALSLAIDIAALSALAAVLLDALRGRKISAVTRVPFGLFLAPAIWLAWLAEVTLLRGSY